MFLQNALIQEEQVCIIQESTKWSNNMKWPVPTHRIERRIHYPKSKENERTRVLYVDMELHVISYVSLGCTLVLLQVMGMIFEFTLTLLE